MNVFRFCRWSLAALPVFFMLAACDKLLPTSGNGELVPVKIRSVSVRGYGEASATRSAGGESRIVGQPIVQDLGGGMFAEITVEEDVSALRDDPTPKKLGGGVKFRIIALKSGSLHDYADYTMPASEPDGGALTPDEGFDELECEVGQTYDFICYSYNSSADLPDWSDGNLSALSVNNSKDLLYWSETGNEIEDGEALSINMKHQFAKVTLELDAGGGKVITDVSGSISLDAPTSGNFDLAEGEFSSFTGSTVFTGWYDAVKNITSAPITFLPKTTGEYTLTIPAQAITLDNGTWPTVARSMFIPAEKFEKGKSYTLLVTLKELSTSTDFAGSNIYWNGSELTFDDPNTTTNTYYQGVFFKWGSLIGISPAQTDGSDDFSSGTTTNEGQNDGTPIYLKVNGEWKKTNVAYATYEGDGKTRWFGTAAVSGKTGSDAWSPIPYSSASTPVGDDAYSLLINPDFEHYKGDICNYINPAYRMPTRNELEALGIGTSGNGDYTWTGSGSATSSDATGRQVFTQFGTFSKTGTDYVLPASGYRDSSSGTLNDVGSYGYYWSGSAYSGTVDAYELGFYGSGSGNAGTDDADRSYCESVRCVKN